VWVIHQSQGLPLRLEPGNDLIAVHARLEHFQRNTAPNRFVLLSQVNDAKATLTELFD
jgi:hypothetical protein